MKFNEFGLNERLIEAISYMGFEEATPIQEQAIPEVLNNQDFIACAQTGTGKTAAFILPILHKIADRKSNHINTLVIVPTRELALQIDQQIQGFAYFMGINSLPVYGGGDGGNWEQQKKALSQGIDIVVATPGKFISHLNMGYVDLSKIEHLILDEADRMLDMGFIDDIQKIISFLPSERQTLLFSATMPEKIREMAKKFQKNPKVMSISLSKPPEGVSQAAALVFHRQKVPIIKSMLNERSNYKSILIFTSTRRTVFTIVKALANRYYKVEGISSDLEQTEREDVLLRFRSKETRVLVATDVLSRGIDIKDIDMVINYDLPNDAEDYVHRIGRTARAETKGEAFTFVIEDELYKFYSIEKLIQTKIKRAEILSEFGKGPEWIASPPKYSKPSKKFSHQKKKQYKR